MKYSYNWSSKLTRVEKIRATIKSTFTVSKLIDVVAFYMYGRYQEFLKHFLVNDRLSRNEINKIVLSSHSKKKVSSVI